MKRGPKPFEHKICPVCGIDKPRSDYYKKGLTVSHKCKPCSVKSSKERAPRYRGKYKETMNRWRNNKYKNDPEYRERISRTKKESYKKRKDAINAARRLEWATNPFCSSRLHYRRKDVKDRTPPWVSKADLLVMYANCHDDRVVDHIIPLKGIIDGRRVSGLHVPWNLQYLSAEANRKKYNRISERDISHLY